MIARVFGRGAAQSKEDYFTASQSQLIWARFKRKRSSMVAAAILLIFVLCGVFADFLSPYDPTAPPSFPNSATTGAARWSPSSRGSSAIAAPTPTSAG